MSNSLKPLHQALEIHLVPAFHDLIILDDQEGRSVQGALLGGGGKAEVVAKMGHGDPPANGNAVTLVNHVLDVDVKIRKSPDEGSVDRLKAFGTNKDRVCIGKAVRLALLVKHFVNRRFAFLIPDLFEPAPKKKFVGLRHKCPPRCGEKLR